MALEVHGPGEGVEGLDVVEEGFEGLERGGVFGEERGGEDHWGWLLLLLLLGF